MLWVKKVTLKTGASKSSKSETFNQPSNHKTYDSVQLSFFFLVFELRFEQTDVDDPVYIDLTFWTPS